IPPSLWVPSPPFSGPRDVRSRFRSVHTVLELLSWYHCGRRRVNPFEALSSPETSSSHLRGESRLTMPIAKEQSDSEAPFWAGKGHEEAAVMARVPESPRLRRLLKDLEALMMTEGFLHLGTD